MPVRKKEAHQALELLEEYHSKLTRGEDQPLREAIEKVIMIFKSRLFQALLDIQEFYEETLLNDEKTLAQKTSETNQIAAKWEINPPIISSNSALFQKQQNARTTEISSTTIKSTNYDSRTTNVQPPTSYQPSIITQQHSPMTNDSWQEIENGKSSLDRQKHIEGGGGGRHANGGGGLQEEWEFEDVVLEKGTSGLGFSIAGGYDNPHVGDDPSIYVTKIIDGGAAAHDGRLKKDDIILRVNTTDTVDVPHHVAVDALKRAGNVIKLFVKRKRVRSVSPPSSNANARNVERIELVKGNKGLGFSIAGGIGNEHIPGDAGIFVTKIIDGGAAQLDGRLRMGDKLVAVGGHELYNVTHETAVAALRATSERVVLKIIKNPHPDLLLNASYDTPPVDASSNADGGGRYYPPARGGTGSPAEHRTYERAPPSGTYVPQLPADHSPYKSSVPPPPTSTGYQPVPRSGSPDVTRAQRTVVLQKGPAGLGFNIVGGEDGEGIYISYILPGGIADVSGSLFKGDQLIQVNGEDLRYATHEIAAQALKNSGPRVHIVAQYKPDDYQRFEAKIEDMRNEMISGGLAPAVAGVPSPRKELFVRALFDYDPTKDSGPSKGLAFNYGDVLHVTNASDDEWWRATKVLLDGREEGFGIIPSKKRVEKRERARRKQVNFTGGRQSSMSEKHSASKKSLSLSRKFPFMKSKERVNDESDVERDAYTSYTSETTDYCNEDLILSYEAVEQQQLNYVRPVVILGPLKDRINDDLISEQPERFGSCVPHTSRARKEHETDARDYHFVSREDMETDIQNHLFIEAGQYNGNLYGTSVASVRAVAQQGKHCILDVSGNAIKRLQLAGLYPIAILIKPFRWQQLTEWNRRMQDDDAQRQYQRTLMIEQEFGESFTAIVQGDTPEEIYSKVKEVLREQSGPVVWIPCAEPL